MFVGIGVGVHRQRFAGSFATSYSSRVIADGGTIEALDCIAAASSLLQSASLLLIPSGYKAGVAYAELPANGNGDLTWSRNSVANRTQSDGNIGSVAANVPRLSYMYGSCPALLLEPQRTNLLPNQLSYIASTGVAYATNVSDSPVIGLNSARITKNEAAGTLRYANQTCINTALTGSTTYTISAYFKYDGYDFQTTMEFNNGVQWGGTIWRQQINIASTGITLGTSSQCTGNIQNVGNGWYRVSTTITTGASIGGVTPVSYLMQLPSTLSTGQGFLQAVPQLEQGAYSTTVIPTSGATATRLVDTFTRNNIYTNGLISASGGTLYAELRNNVSYLRDVASDPLELVDAGANNGFFIRPSSVSSRLIITKRQSGVLSTLFTTTTDTVKIAIKWNGTSADVFVNGTKQVSATAFTTTIMENLNGRGNAVPIFIQAMALYPTPLSDAECQTLTT